MGSITVDKCAPTTITRAPWLFGAIWLVAALLITCLASVGLYSRSGAPIYDPPAQMEDWHGNVRVMGPTR